MNADERISIRHPILAAIKLKQLPIPAISGRTGMGDILTIWPRVRPQVYR